MKDNKHTFALFLSDISNFKKCKNFTIKDNLIHSRIIKILRMKIGESLIFFNDCFNALVQISQVNKKEIIFEIKAFNNNVHRKQKIHAFVGLTKKPAFEEMIYFSSQVGIDSITPIICSKSHKSWWNENCLSKFKNISIAAREQSKNFNSLEIREPQNLFDINFSCFDQKVYFDLSNTKIFDKKEEIKVSKKIAIFIGSEGGFSSEEIELLTKNNVEKIGLTKTILRTQEALLLGAGSLMCILDKK